MTLEKLPQSSGSEVKTINIQNLAPVVALIGAVIVAATGNDGWGWLIFAALLLSA